jgi:hypothetical protein
VTSGSVCQSICSLNSIESQRKGGGETERSSVIARWRELPSVRRRVFAPLHWHNRRRRRNATNRQQTGSRRSHRSIRLPVRERLVASHSPPRPRSPPSCKSPAAGSAVPAVAPLGHDVRPRARPRGATGQQSDDLVRALTSQNSGAINGELP